MSRPHDDGDWVDVRADLPSLQNPTPSSSSSIAESHVPDTQHHDVSTLGAGAASQGHFPSERAGSVISTPGNQSDAEGGSATGSEHGDDADHLEDVSDGGDLTAADRRQGQLEQRGKRPKPKDAQERIVDAGGSFVRNNVEDGCEQIPSSAAAGWYKYASESSDNSASAKFAANTKQFLAWLPVDQRNALRARLTSPGYIDNSPRSETTKFFAWLPEKDRSQLLARLKSPHPPPR